MTKSQRVPNSNAVLVFYTFEIDFFSVDKKTIHMNIFSVVVEIRLLLAVWVEHFFLFILFNFIVSTLPVASNKFVSLN